MFYNDSELDGWKNFRVGIFLKEKPAMVGLKETNNS